MCMWAWSPVRVYLSGRSAFRSSQWADRLSDWAKHRAWASGPSLIHIRLEKRKKIKSRKLICPLPLSNMTLILPHLTNFSFCVSSLPTLWLHTPSPPSSSAVWSTPPCARGKDEGHRSLFFHENWFLCPTTGSTRVRREFKQVNHLSS